MCRAIIKGNEFLLVAKETLPAAGDRKVAIIRHAQEAIYGG
jgi:hypothetical protein